MNQTAAATSSSSTSSAAAVADSANAAATTKTADSVSASVVTAGSATAAAAASTTTTTKSTSVKLLIKASNQQFDDQIIDSDLLWTVKRLKTHLALVYPNKPPVDEQKLIYSGQLLNDALLLKDVIRNYKDVYTQNHIIHLVYTPKNINFMQKSKPSSTVSAVSSKMSPSGTTTDGLRQRHTTGVAASSTTAQQNYQQQYYQQYQQQQSNFTQVQSNQQLNQQCPMHDANNPLHALPLGFPGQFNMQAMATQQAAMYNWMQQVYSQYMEQCIRMSNTTAAVAGVATPNIIPTTTNAPPVVASPLPFNPFLQQMPHLPSAPAVGVVNAGTTNPVIPVIPSTVTATLLAQPARHLELSAAQTFGQPSTETDTAAQSDVAERAEPAQVQQAAPERPQAAAPRFPNIVQDEQEHRDWLDSFFSITRLAIFLTILYFNSSPLRCLAVVIIAGVIYLYHIGVLRLRNERNNNNINRNNNAAEADQIRRGVQQVQQAAQAAEHRNPENAVGGANVAVDGQPSTANAAAAEGTAVAVIQGAGNNSDANTASVISVLRTFVVTFFTSLLPETPTL